MNIFVTLMTIVLGEILGGVLPLWLRNIPWLMTSLPSWYTWILVPHSEPRSYQLALLFAGVIAIPSFIPLLLMQDDRPGSNQSVLAVSLPRLHVSSMRKIRSFLLADMASVSSLSRLHGLLAHPMSLRQQRFVIRILFESPLFALVVVQILIGLGAGLFIPYFKLYFVKHLGASSALFGFIDGCANLLNAVLALFAPWLVVHIGKVRAILFPRLLSLPIMLVIGLTNFLPLATVLYPMRQGLMDMSQGILQVFSMEAVQQQHRGLANSSYQAASQLASACGAPIGGLIIAHQGYPPVFICATILYALALAVIWLRFGRSDDSNSAKPYTRFNQALSLSR